MLHGFYEVPRAFGLAPGGCDHRRRRTKRLGLGTGGDSFYEYLFKEQLVTPENKADAWRQAAMFDWLEERLVEDQGAGSEFSIGKHVAPTANNLTHLRTPGLGDVQLVEHLVMFAPGLLALAATHPDRKGHASDATKRQALDLAVKLNDAHAALYDSTAAGLGPEYAKIVQNGTRKHGASYYALRPEYVESLFYLYRVTGDPKYRHRGWTVFANLRKHCQLSTGAFAGLKDVYARRLRTDGEMPSFFLAETLKYLYLLFSPTDHYPIHDWIFTTEAHLISRTPTCQRRTCTGPTTPPLLHALPLDAILLGAALICAFDRYRARAKKRKPQKHTV